MTTSQMQNFMREENTDEHHEQQQRQISADNLQQLQISWYHGFAINHWQKHKCKALGGGYSGCNALW